MQIADGVNDSAAVIELIEAAFDIKGGIPVGFVWRVGFGKQTQFSGLDDLLLSIDKLGALPKDVLKMEQPELTATSNYVFLIRIVAHQYKSHQGIFTHCKRGEQARKLVFKSDYELLGFMNEAIGR